MNAEVRSILQRALAGESLTVDRDRLSLHDLTQVAVAMRPEAGLVIRRAEFMTPIERASIATVSRGRIAFR